MESLISLKEVFMAKTEEEYMELLTRARKVMKEQKEIIDQLRGQVDWALALLEQGQAIMKSQDAEIKLLKMKVGEA